MSLQFAGIRASSLLIFTIISIFFAPSCSRGSELSSIHELDGIHIKINAGRAQEGKVTFDRLELRSDDPAKYKITSFQLSLAQDENRDGMLSGSEAANCMHVTSLKAPGSLVEPVILGGYSGISAAASAESWFVADVETAEGSRRLTWRANDTGPLGLR